MHVLHSYITIWPLTTVWYLFSLLHTLVVNVKDFLMMILGLLDWRRSLFFQQCCSAPCSSCEMPNRQCVAVCPLLASSGQGEKFYQSCVCLYDDGLICLWVISSTGDNNILIGGISHLPIVLDGDATTQMGG